MNIHIDNYNYKESSKLSEEPKPHDTQPDQYSTIESAFYFNHIWMFFTVIVIIIVSFIVNTPLYRYIILMETFISSVSSYIYYLLLNKIQINHKKKEVIDWKGITVLRYNGWMFTTPVMLIAFLLFLSTNTKIKLTIPIAVIIILLDWLMLYLGYLGEIGNIARNTALVTGFIPFFIMFGIIYQTFLRNKYVFFNYIIFTLFVIFWGLYGVGYMLDLEPRNYLMNVLDLLSKSGIGLLFAFYFLFTK